MTPWKHASEQPKTQVVAIIANQPPGFDDFALLADLYVWRRGAWVSEVSGDCLEDDDFWWCAEDDLMAHLDTVAATRRNGHGSDRHTNPTAPETK